MNKTNITNRFLVQDKQVTKQQQKWLIHFYVRPWANNGGPKKQLNNNDPVWQFPEQKLHEEIIEKLIRQLN